MDDLIRVLQPAASGDVMQKMRAMQVVLAQRQDVAAAAAGGSQPSESGVFRGEEAVVEQNGAKFIERWSTTGKLVFFVSSRLLSKKTQSVSGQRATVCF
jgi:hypothetical protein